MTVDVATLIGVWTAAAGSFGSVAMVIFYFGKLTERVKAHDERIAVVETKLDGHETRLSHLEGRTR